MYVSVFYCGRDEAPPWLSARHFTTTINLGPTFTHRTDRQIMNQELMPAKDQPKEKGNMFQAFLPLIMKKVGKWVDPTPLHQLARAPLRKGFLGCKPEFCLSISVNYPNPG